MKLLNVAPLALLLCLLGCETSHRQNANKIASEYKAKDAQNRLKADVLAALHDAEYITGMKKHQRWSGNFIGTKAIDQLIDSASATQSLSPGFSLSNEIKRLKECNDLIKSATIAYGNLFKKLDELNEKEKENFNAYIKAQADRIEKEKLIAIADGNFEIAITNLYYSINTDFLAPEIQRDAWRLSVPVDRTGFLGLPAIPCGVELLKNPPSPPFVRGHSLPLDKKACFVVIEVKIKNISKNKILETHLKTYRDVGATIANSNVIIAHEYISEYNWNLVDSAGNTYGSSSFRDCQITPGDSVVMKITVRNLQTPNIDHLKLSFNESVFGKSMEFVLNKTILDSSLNIFNDKNYSLKPCIPLN